MDARRQVAGALALALAACAPLSAEVDWGAFVDGRDLLALAPVEGVGGVDAASPARMPSVLVIVEDRLLDGDAAGALVPSLRTYAEDLAAEGWRPIVLRAAFARDGGHRDGRQLLRLREVLRAQAADDLRFGGAVLVGAFPEAFLVRTVNWRKRTTLVLRKGTPDERRFDAPVPYLRTVPEAVAHTCDLVLADLDGRWETLYVEGRERLPTLLAVFEGGVPDGGGTTAAFERGTVTFEDFFHVHDGQVDVREVVGDDGAVVALHVVPRDDDRDAEGSALDRLRPNPIARPEIAVSRVDAGGVADDLAHELELLVRFFARNHAYRTGALDVAFRPASLAHDLRSGYRVVRRASDAWRGADPDALDVRGKPTLADARAWFARPAVLRTIRAHSDRWGSMLEKGKLDAKVLRRFHDEGVTGGGASIYLHTGCEAISPAEAERLPWHDPAYGRANGAAATLFLADGLALIGRAKVFYDEPPGFCETLRDGGTVGDAWRTPFEIEAAAPTWDRVGGDIGRKRTSFWSLLGDWTLRLVDPRPGV